MDVSRRENQFDAFAATPPIVRAQSYAYATTIAALGITLTNRGITPKQVYIYTLYINLCQHRHTHTRRQSYAYTTTIAAWASPSPTGASRRSRYICIEYL